MSALIYYVKNNQKNMVKLLQATSQTDKTVEIINAIGNSWPLVLIIILTIVFFTYRKSIGVFISKFTKVSGKTSMLEVSLERESENKPIDSKPQEEKLSIELKQDFVEVTETTKGEINFYEIYEKLSEGKISEANTNFNIMQVNETNPSIKEKNSITFLYYKQLYSGINTLVELESKIEETKNGELKLLVYKYLGNCYLRAKDYVTAIERYTSAYHLSHDESEQTEINIKISICMNEQGNQQEAINFLNSTIAKTKNHINISELYHTISTFYDSSTNWLEKCLILELAVSYNPNNTQYLFDCAYNFSDNKANSSLSFLSLLHYKELIHYKTNSREGLNNLGVAYNNFRLNNKAVNMYQKAANMKETLAISNLANKYISQGLFEDAKALLEPIKTVKDVHQNVWDSLKAIKEEEEREEKEEKRIITEAKTVQLFLREFAQIYFSSDLNIEIAIGISNEWKVKNEQIEVVNSENQEYVTVSWADQGDRYKVNLKLKNNKAFIGEAECIRKEFTYHTSKLSMFGLSIDNSLKLLFLDKDINDKSYIFTFLK